MAEGAPEQRGRVTLSAGRQELVDSIFGWMEAAGFEPKPTASASRLVGVSVRDGIEHNPRKARTIKVGIQGVEAGLQVEVEHRATPRFGLADAASEERLAAEIESLLAHLRGQFASVPDDVPDPAVVAAPEPEEPSAPVSTAATPDELDAISAQSGAATPDELDAISEPMGSLPVPSEQASLDEDLLIRMWFGESDDLDSRLRAAVSVAAAIAQAEGLKTFPAVAAKVLRLLEEPEFSMNQVSGAIHEDPSLASAVLRVANSSMFYASNPLGDIQAALVRLGSDNVAEVVCSVATMQMFPAPSGVAREIRNHCAGTAALFRYLTLDHMPHRSTGTFLAGLLHDVGKLLLIESGEFSYEGAAEAEALSFDGIWPEERRVLAYDHAILGGQILKRWNIPEPIPRIVAMHHQPGRASSFTDVGPLVAMLRVADRLDHALREQPEAYERYVGALAASADFTEVGVTEAWLLEHWIKLYSIRADAFALFKT